MVVVVCLPPATPPSRAPQLATLPHRGGHPQATPHREAPLLATPLNKVRCQAMPQKTGSSVLPNE